MMRTNGLILVVDDNLVDCELIESAFRIVGVTAEIRLVNNGAEAIAYLSGQKNYANRDEHPYPSLILTDLKMPIADGFAVLEFLRDHAEIAVIPTVVFSGSSDPDDVRTSYRLGASSYIVKPSTAAELQHHLRIMVEYWCLCEAPLTTSTGEHVKTDSRGKLGERFSRKPFPAAEKPPAKSESGTD